MLSNKSLYIHIPFCASKCPYCGFYSVYYNKGIASSYIDVILKEITSLHDTFYTIYVGGGTPTVFDPGQLKKILCALRKYAHKSREFTIEVNPESLDSEKLSLFLDNGVNRISIGVQSFNDDKLKRLGRPHDARCAKKCVDLVLKKGFKNISIDLIFGLRGETLESWKNDLKEATLLPVKHISSYSLTCEKHLKPACDDAMAEMYKYAILYLEDAGFKQYEISNFALDGYQCRHNLNYWEGGHYKGLGPSAISYEEETRKENIADIEEYVRRIEKGESPVVSKEKLSPEARAREAAAIKIRTMEGIGMEWFKEKTGFRFLSLEKDAVQKLIGDGLIECSDKAVRLTPKGILFCDIVSSAFV